MANTTATKQDTGSDIRTARHEESPSVRRLVVSPGTVKSIGVGVYSRSARTPNFALTFTPDMGDQITAACERLDIPGASKYMLLYQFHNFGTKPCQVAIVSDPK